MDSRRDCTTLDEKLSKNYYIAETETTQKISAAKNSCSVGQPVGTAIDTCPLPAFPSSAPWKTLLETNPQCTVDVIHCSSQYSNNTGLVPWLVSGDGWAVWMAGVVRHFSFSPIIACCDRYLLFSQQMITWSFTHQTCLARKSTILNYALKMRHLCCIGQSCSK